MLRSMRVCSDFSSDRAAAKLCDRSVVRAKEFYVVHDAPRQFSFFAAKLPSFRRLAFPHAPENLHR